MRNFGMTYGVILWSLRRTGINMAEKMYFNKALTCLKLNSKQFRTMISTVEAGNINDSVQDHRRISVEIYDPGVLGISDSILKISEDGGEKGETETLVAESDTISDGDYSLSEAFRFAQEEL